MRDPRMCRPRDRENEKDVAQTLSVHYGLGFILAGPDCAYDFTLVRPGEPPKVEAVVEVKTRRMVFGDYATIHLSLNKVRYCLHAAESAGAQFVFAIKCDNGIYVTAITPEMFKSLPRKVGGRFDRLDRNISTDIEELLDIPISEFEKIT